jgi:hypothetical protein
MFATAVPSFFFNIFCKVAVGWYHSLSARALSVSIKTAENRYATDFALMSWTCKWRIEAMSSMVKTVKNYYATKTYLSGP